MLKFSNKNWLTHAFDSVRDEFLGVDTFLIQWGAKQSGRIVLCMVLTSSSIFILFPPSHLRLRKCWREQLREETLIIDGDSKVVKPRDAIPQVGVQYRKLLFCSGAPTPLRGFLSYG